MVIKGRTFLPPSILLVLMARSGSGEGTEALKGRRKLCDVLPTLVMRTTRQMRNFLSEV